ncbi:MAG: hypothetical protein ACE5H2_02940 [Terriglobia bacterium]
MRTTGNTSMTRVPRRAWQTLTVWFIVFAACVWWYVDTRSIVFLFLLGWIVFAAAWTYKHDMANVRAGKKDARGLITVIGNLRRKGRIVFLAFISAPFIFTGYGMLRERTILPSDAYDLDPSFIGWFMFAGFCIAFSIWVIEAKERFFWIVIGVFFLVYGLRALLLPFFSGLQSFSTIAGTFSICSAIAELALLLTGWWVLYSLQSG